MGQKSPHGLPDAAVVSVLPWNTSPVGSNLSMLLARQSRLAWLATPIIDTIFPKVKQALLVPSSISHNLTEFY
jgi:hypothetical protein